LGDLVTHSLDEYERLALRLATDPSLLDAVRARLRQPTRPHPLFDIDRHGRNIESAFATMWDIHQRGEKPRSFSMEPPQATK
jgi:predicted O-linked N-acetylglucosamine transferase (SPINDLY family)